MVTGSHRYHGLTSTLPPELISPPATLCNGSIPRCPRRRRWHGWREVAGCTPPAESSRGPGTAALGSPSTQGKETSSMSLVEALFLDPYPHNANSLALFPQNYFIAQRSDGLFGS